MSRFIAVDIRGESAQISGLQDRLGEDRSQKSPDDRAKIPSKLYVGPVVQRQKHEAVDCGGRRSRKENLESDSFRSALRFL